MVLTLLISMVTSYHTNRYNALTFSYLEDYFNQNNASRRLSAKTCESKRTNEGLSREHEFCSWILTCQCDQRHFCRGLFFEAGADRVDTLTASRTRPVTRDYEKSNAPFDSEEQQPFVLVNKEFLECGATTAYAAKNPPKKHTLGAWAEANFPHLVPNDLPF